MAELKLVSGDIARDIIEERRKAKVRTGVADGLCVKDLAHTVIVREQERDEAREHYAACQNALDLLESEVGRITDQRDAARRERDDWRKLAKDSGMSHESTVLELIDTRAERDRLAREARATHRCKVCRALWIDQDDSWSPASRECGQCCNNVAMGEQIEEIGTPAVMAERDALRAQLNDIWLHCTGVVCTAEEGPKGDNIPALVKELRQVCEDAQEQRGRLTARVTTLVEYLAAEAGRPVDQVRADFDIE